MYITFESDYAVRITSCLAMANTKLDAKTISETTCVPLRFALKILRKLVAGGIIKSYKGYQGGYKLAKSPDEITLKDVIEAIEGTYNFSRCLDDGFDCSRGMSGICCYQRAFGEISNIVRQKLEEYTFGDLIKIQNHIEDCCENCADCKKDCKIKG